MNPLLAVAIQQTPAIIALLKDAFAKQNPDAPTPSNEQVIAAYQLALTASLSKDAQWLLEHPEIG